MKTNNITLFADYEPEEEIHIPDSDGTCCEVVECIEEEEDSEELDFDAFRAAEADEAWMNLRDAINSDCFTL